MSKVARHVHDQCYVGKRPVRNAILVAGVAITAKASNRVEYSRLVDGCRCLILELIPCISS